MRRHTVFGECVVTGVLLCGAARHYDETILSDSTMKTDCEMHFIFKCRARVYFPKSGQQLLDLFVLLRKRGVQTTKAKREADAKDEEWMYRVEGAETSDPITLLNNAWDAYLAGEPDAREVLAACTLSAGQKGWLEDILAGPDAQNGKDHRDDIDPCGLL